MIDDDHRVYPKPEPSAVDRLAALEDPTGDAARKVARWEGHKVAEFKERWRWFDAWLS